MQLWMEINVVTLRKFVETMPPQKRSIIKAKGGPGFFFFFLDGQCIFIDAVRDEESASEHIY